MCLASGQTFSCLRLGGWSVCCRGRGCGGAGEDGGEGPGGEGEGGDEAVSLPAPPRHGAHAPRHDGPGEIRAR
eukprot:2681104-Rhodomonas_salina.1